MMSHGQFDRSGLQDLGPKRCQFQHLLVGQAIEFAGLANQSWVGRIDTIDIGIDITSFNTKGSGDRDGRRIRAAPAQGRHPILR